MAYIGRHVLSKFGGDRYGSNIKVVNPQVKPYVGKLLGTHRCEEVWYDNGSNMEGQRVLIGLNNIDDSVSDVTPICSI